MMTVFGNACAQLLVHRRAKTDRRLLLPFLQATPHLVESLIPLASLLAADMSDPNMTVPSAASFTFSSNRDAYDEFSQIVERNNDDLVFSDV
ncbi:hypothetical protein TSUD_11830 [Trifolium subterraneum]|uniref:Uncharacterized protein n=1 Tax=Trifolium subterraneum TaxID=3900 RepID=A0A2Z6LPC8_TRISU|nr:hypothetical protein TSUD_11830 [Trifolium subterraneum]